MTSATDSQAPAIDFWFDFASHYSYLSAMRIEALAAPAGVQVRWRPFLLGPVFASFGWNNSPFVLQKEKGAYTWKDIARQCQKYQLPWRMPSVFPRPSTLALKVAAAGREADWIGAYCRACMTRNFALDQDFNSPQAVHDILTELGLDAATIIADAQSPAKSGLLRQATAEAQALGIFGAPMFFVAGEMFWGNDRLDDALDLALYRG
ncbi:MAG: 2-hydroxychromene-2-carboxylate isomerase [Leptothrix sp. (in: b-proteobacteria)]